MANLPCDIPERKSKIPEFAASPRNTAVARERLGNTAPGKVYSRDTGSHIMKENA
jgi:hypothetical protein